MSFRLLSVFSLLIFFGLIPSSCSRGEEAAIYKIALQDWDGRSHRLSEFQGQLLILDFWASWCEPCKKAVPVVEALKDDLHAQNAKVLGVNTENDLSILEIKEAAQEFGMDYPSLLDPDWKLVNLLKIEGQPALFVFSKSGKRLHFQYGISEKDLPVLRGRLRNWLESP
ncbi:TlpA family protein disulfide reductase [Leptospira inadai]|nr:TlpA disulfide reductase family protein [Leptospira inadai]PNV74862.1 TlpA family protein disulfide reductase [Leptospira inadai serovar Lyme]